MQESLCGYINVFKSPGMTSHDVVAFVRHLAGKNLKVGHLGTLDPGACGVLPVAVGWATRTVDYFPPARKQYMAEVLFGVETDSCDAFGTVTARGNVSFSDAELSKACEKFSGEIMQVPPSFSALHVNGVRSYELIRAGQSVELPARPATYYGVTVLARQGERARLQVDCGAGTYVRALARDLGRDLGCGASLAFLLRTRSGGFFEHSAVTLQELKKSGLREHLLAVPPVLGQALGGQSAQPWFVEGRFFGGGQTFSEVRSESGEVLTAEQFSQGTLLMLHARQTGRFIGLARVMESSVSGILQPIIRIERFFSEEGE